ncbi:MULTISPECIES: hypothetical protein [Kosakonia]|nr:MULTISPECIES: hypothetical protein [Kosakonia]
MNRCFPQNLSRRSGVRLFPATCISNLQTCRCYTHFGASQDSRAGKAL